jgi:hypothetical protein
MAANLTPLSRSVSRKAALRSSKVELGGEGLHEVQDAIGRAGSS